MDKSGKRIINIPSDTTHSYISVFNFIFKMTERELEVMAHFVEWDRKIRTESLGIETFGTSVRKSIAEKLNMSNINTYIQKLKSKHVIREDKGKLIVNPLLVTENVNEVVFRFKPNDQSQEIS